MPATIDSIERNTVNLISTPVKHTDVVAKSMPRKRTDLKRSMSLAEERAEPQIRTFDFLRSETTSGELPMRSKANELTRSKSIGHRFSESDNKSTSQVNTAKFYDWSESPDNCFSTSRLYREIASISRGPSRKCSKVLDHKRTTTQTNSYPSFGSGIRQYTTYPRRMFTRDKKLLTKGEREIIDGIYKNRGDIGSYDAIGKSEFQVKCHKDAWNVGKSPFKNFGRKTLLKRVKIDEESLTSCYHQNMDISSVSSISDEWRSENTASNTTANSAGSLHLNDMLSKRKVINSSDQPPVLVCEICQANRDAYCMSRRTPAVQYQEDYLDEGPPAPPGTPDHTKMCQYLQTQPLHDKLLDMRPMMSICSTHKLQNISLHNTDCEQINGNKKHRSKLSKNSTSKLYFRVPVLLNWALDDFSDLKVQSLSSVRQINNIKSNNQNKVSCMTSKKTLYDRYDISRYHTQYNVVHTDQQEENNDNTDLNKRLKMKVYIPTAEYDHIEQDLTPVLESTKKRSHKQKRHLNVLNAMA